uniref:TIR domain-containing protein n=1 Tax=Cyclopterus lumpus TaxID=8103 RepID=A0A8C3AIY9_CYCLU
TCTFTYPGMRVSFTWSAEPQCEGFDVESFYLLEGEAFYFEPYALDSGPLDKMFTWFRKNNNNKTENITSDENEDVHHHGGALFFLNPLIKDSGQCYDYYANFDVSPTVIRRNLYPEIKNSDVNKRIPCPDPIQHTCAVLNGSFTWNKVPHNHKDHLWIYNMAKADEGIYTCICTWTHNGKEYKSSGSRSLEMEGEAAFSAFYLLLLKIHGSLKSCIALANILIDSCIYIYIYIYIYIQYIYIYIQVNLRPSSTTISTAILTIDKVSAQDFKATFECRGQGMYKLESVSLNLKRRVPLFVGGVCVLIFCVFAAMLVKCFAIELVLFFRPCFPFSCYGRLFDAYVVYQMQSPDKVTEDTLGHFVAKILPSVLEDKCGYRLFIHGRDDVPGEDRLELVEDRMKQSRRLMVILTPGSGSESESSDQHSVSPQNPEIGGFDWQVGLHHVLLQREMSVILIQLGDQGPQGYTHLPAGLQHLILKNAPIRWPEGSRGAGTRNSRFWKRVRYLMPATPAKRCPQSAVI